MHPYRYTCACLLGLLLVLGCASAPPAPTPGTGTLYGDLRLMPRAGVQLPAGGGEAYGDLRMREVQFVDYSRPGFAVVWLDGREPDRSGARVTIRANAFETRIDPPWVAIASGGTLELSNQSSEPHTVSCPSLGVLRRIAAGEAIELRVAEAGAHPLFLLDRPQVEGGVFAASGPFAVLTRSGHFELRDVSPGPAQLRAWHPRMPPLEVGVEIVADQARRVDLEMGVGRGGETEQ